MIEHPEAITRYPLQWPIGWKRTKFNERVSGSFSETKWSQSSDSRTKRQVPVANTTAMERLERQIDELGGTDPVMSSNLRLRLNGAPDLREEPTDPGVAVYFRFKTRATVLACDRYRRVADNIAAIAAHIDALRRIDRYGVGTLEQALAGYRSLPADTAANWRNVFGFGESEVVTSDKLQQRFRERAATAHPDKGGTDEMMMHVNRAREYALSELMG